MALFAVPQRAGRSKDSAIAKKANTKSKSSSVTTKSGGGIVDQIAIAKAIIEKNLAKYKDDYIIIRDKVTLHNYVQNALDRGVIAIDTETTGLDPLQDRLVGLCLYTPGMKGAYIPIGHVSYVTGMPVPDQLTYEEVGECMNPLVSSSIEIVEFNAAFDTRVMRKWLGVNIVCTWDCYLAARLLNENEGAGNNGLKPLHNKYVLKGKEDAFSFGDIFKGLTFDKVPISLGYIYAAHDPVITYELYEFQKPFLDNGKECERRGLKDVAWVFHNIEMPCVQVICDMEDTGVDFDMNYNAELKEKYHALLEQSRTACYKSIDMYSAEIEQYKKKTPNHKLDTPINIGSTTQLAILLYDIIGVESVDKNKPRGTGEEILKKIDNPICNAVMEYRALDKLVGTYIDKLPDCVNPNDGRIHCKFNQYGADTGRMSSNDPNLQNIPSHNKDIRKMFKATDGYLLMSSDYGQQEPRSLAAMCAKAGDSRMKDAFLAGKDIYSEIASKAFQMSYLECLEHFPKGTPIKKINGSYVYSTLDKYDKLADGDSDVYNAGKERRSQAKSKHICSFYVNLITQGCA